MLSAWFILWFIWDALVFTSAVFAGICIFRVSLSSYTTLLVRGGELTPYPSRPPGRNSGQTQRCILKR